MAVLSDATCGEFSGSAAPFISQVRVEVDGVTVARIDHAATDDGPWWSFSGALELSGDHTVTVFDRTAGNDYRQEGDNVHATYHLSCPVVATTVTATTTTEAPTTTVATTVQATVVEPVATVALAASSVVPVPTMPEGLYVIDLGTTTVATTMLEPVGCCSEYVAEVSTVATLPATGGVTDGVVPMGFGVLGVGVMLLTGARRTRRA